MMKAVIIALAAVAMAGIPAGADEPHVPDMKPAVAAAEQWLTLVDGERYAESWSAAAGYFTNAVTRAQWETAARAARKPLGKMVARKLKHAAYHTALPGAPDGQYVVIQFDTIFTEKKEAVETVTPMLDKDGTWRVSGYFIR